MADLKMSDAMYVSQAQVTKYSCQKLLFISLFLSFSLLNLSFFPFNIPTFLLCYLSTGLYPQQFIPWFVLGPCEHQAAHLNYLEVINFLKFSYLQQRGRREEKPSSYR